MVLTELWQQIGFAVAGGLAAEVLHWYMLTRRPGGAARFRARSGYWLWTIGMIAMGGLMPALYIDGSATALLCFHLGAATPLLLQKLVTALPAMAQAQGVRTSLRDFLTW
jgi:hypothetical protein